MAHEWTISFIIARYIEFKDYSYSTAASANGKAVGHFTQMVWKDTMKFGVGVATMESRKNARYADCREEHIISIKYYVDQFQQNWAI